MDLKIKTETTIKNARLLKKLNKYLIFYEEE